MKDTQIYKTVKNCSIKADIYYENKNEATIIYLHGGALIWGTRSSIPQEQIDLYNKSGFNVVSIDYRLAPETKLQSIVEDIRDAINWIRNEGSKRYGIDPEKIFIMGSSAGGYLSLLVGTGIIDFRPKAIVSLYGYGDILGDWYNKPSDFYCQRHNVTLDDACNSVGNKEISEGTIDRFIFYLYCRQKGVWVNKVTGYDTVRDKHKLLNYNPIDNLTAEYPSTLLLHGNKDTDVPYEQSVIMNELLKKVGVNSELIIINDVGHEFDRDFNNIDVQNVFKKIIQFLKKHI